MFSKMTDRRPADRRSTYNYLSDTVQNGYYCTPTGEHDERRTPATKQHMRSANVTPLMSIKFPPLGPARRRTGMCALPVLNPAPREKFKTLTLPGGAKIFCNWTIQEFLNNYDYPAVTVKDKYLLLGDSIVKNVDNLKNTLVISYPGATISKMLVLIRHGKVPEIANKSIILLHFGTNDINSVSYDDMMYQTHQLVRLVQTKSDYYCTVAISHIIPRAIDHKTTESIINKYNNSVVSMKHKWHFDTVPTYSTFLTNDLVPMFDLYKTTDLLHPNDKGDSRLRSHISNHIAKLRLEKGFKRTKRTPHQTIIRRSKACIGRRAARRVVN